MANNLLQNYDFNIDPLTIRGIIQYGVSQASYPRAKSKLLNLRALGFEQVQQRFNIIQKIDQLKEEGNNLKQHLLNFEIQKEGFDKIEAINKGEFYTLKELHQFTLIVELSSLLKKHDFFKVVDKDHLILKDLKSDLVTPVRQLVDQNGSLNLERHPELKPILEEIETVDKEIRLKINKLFSTKEYKDRLESNQFDIINGRYVLCINTFKYAYSIGSILDKSKSGNILYIEPPSIKSLNNHRENLDIKLQEKLNAIIYKISERLHLHSRLLKSLSKTINFLDLMQSIQLIGKRFDLSRPNINTDYKLRLESLFHPAVENCIRNNFHFNSESDFSLCLSGTNTGGKTVYLKSLCINILFANWGIFCSSTNSEIPITDQLFYINNDSQDLTKGLSSFSGEASEIIDLLKSSKNNSYIFIDEIFSSTGSEEASLLAEGIIKEFSTRKDYFLFFSTHHERLKRAMLSENGVISAHVEFDRENLKPTYKISFGTPGSSEALNIFKIICNSKNYNFDLLAKYLKEEKGPEEKQEEKYKEKFHQLELQKMKLHSDMNKLESEKNDLEKSRSEFIIEEKQKLLLWIEKEKELFTKNLATKESRKAIKLSGNKEIQKVSDKLKINQQDSKALNIPRAELLENNYYYCDFLKQDVYLEKLTKEKSYVAHKKMKLWVKNDTLFKSITGKTKTSSVSVSKTIVTSTKLDLRGHKLEEFKDQVLPALQSLLLDEIPYLDIIHGHGDGVLKRWLREYLNNNKDDFLYEIPRENDGQTNVRPKA